MQLVHEFAMSPSRRWWMSLQIAAVSVRQILSRENGFRSLNTLLDCWETMVRSNLSDWWRHNGHTSWQKRPFIRSYFIFTDRIQNKAFSFIEDWKIVYFIQNILHRELFSHWHKEKYVRETKLPILIFHIKNYDSI